MSVIVVLLSALFPASAQNYTTDAILKRTTGKIATLECSGIARTKKEAIEMAKKSVIYTYLYNGIDGLNDNKPLLGSKPSAGAAQYVGQLLGTTRYANYIRSCTIADKTNKTAVIFLTNKQNVGFKPNSMSYYSPYSCCGEICELVWNIFGTEAPAETLADKIGTWL